MTSQSWREGPLYLLATLTLVNTVNWADRQVVPILVPSIQEDLGLSDTEMGLIGGLAFSLVYAVAAFLFGYLADRSSRRAVVLFGLGCWSMATAASGLATDFWTLFAARFVTGIGEASLYPCAMSLLADAFGADRRGRAIGILGASTAMGSGLGLGLGGWLVQEVGWRSVFFLYGSSGLLVLPLLLVMREPARKPMPAGEGHDAPVVIVTEALRDPRLLAVWASGTLLIAAATGWITWAPTFFARDLQFDMSQIGVVFGAAQLFGGVAGSVLGGQLGDRRRRLRFAGQLRVSAVAALIAAPIFALALVESAPHALLMSAAVIGPLVVFAAFPNLQTIVAEIVPARRLGMTFAVHVLFLSGVGAAAGPFLVGWLSDLTGSLRVALVVPCVAALLAGLAALWAERVVIARTPVPPR
jgi:MFS family permease